MYDASPSKGGLLLHAFLNRYLVFIFICSSNNFCLDGLVFFLPLLEVIFKFLQCGWVICKALDDFFFVASEDIA